MSQSIKTTLDLSRFPAPDVIESLNFEGIYDELVASFLSIWAEKRVLRPDLPEINTVDLESDVIATVFQAWAYRELLIRSRVNNAARSNLLAFAGGADLDHIGANYGVGRMTIVPATETDPAVMESDERFRQRINLRVYAYSSAGSIESYIFHAMSADPLIKDVAVDNPHTSRIDLTVLSAVGDGSPTSDQLSAVADALSPTAARPLTDDVRVRSATIISQPVVLRISIPSGPSPDPIRQLALQRVGEYAASRHRIGRALRVDGIVGAARAAGELEQVVVIEPTADIIPGISGAVHVPSVTVEMEVLS